MEAFDYQPPSRVLFGAGSLSKLGEIAAGLDFKHALLVADGGIVASGIVDEARDRLEQTGVAVTCFHGFDSNPDNAMIEAGRRFAASLQIDSIVGLGGGSSMDCAKGINFLLTNGGSMRDYWGFGKAGKPMLPMIGIPTTAGTGSEAQSYALISDAETHVKMACGDPKAMFRVVILDPVLTVSQPKEVTAMAGYDAIAHAVETYVTKNRNALSEMYSREAWRLLESNFERVLAQPGDLDARGAMQLGAYYAGVAIENSMLGATHACANPLTARYGTAHGVAIALFLAAVVRWNEPLAAERYKELSAIAGGRTVEDLIERLEQLAIAGGLPRRLSEIGVPSEDLSSLSEDAARQWTGTFNPRPFDLSGAVELYQSAF
jgi:alcohol dehydrogenase